MHRIRFGDTLATISQHYYGSRAYAQLLQLANGLPSERLDAGDHIRIPTAWHYTVRKTTTLKGLATRFLGDARRWPALAMINQLRRKRKRVRAGTRLEIPFVLPYTVSASDTFAELSQRFYGTKKYGGLIASYNFITATSPSAGTQIEIPMGKPRITKVRLEQLTNERLLGVSSEADREQREGLQESNAMLRRGEYWAVPLRLVKLLAQDHTSDALMAEVYKLLAIAYVAVDQHDLAVRAFQEALLRQPGLGLDVVTTSPKVFRALVDAKATLHQGGR
jgi:hypothetical protein